MESVFLDAIASRRDSLRRRVAEIEKQLDEFSRDELGDVDAAGALQYGQNYWQRAELRARLTVYGQDGQRLQRENINEVEALLLATQIAAGKQIAESLDDATSTRRFIEISRAHESLYLLAMLDVLKKINEVYNEVASGQTASDNTQAASDDSTDSTDDDDASPFYFHGARF